MVWECLFEQFIDIPKGKYCIFSFTYDDKDAIYNISVKIQKWLTQNGIYNVIDTFQISLSDDIAYLIVVKIPLLYKIAFEEFSSELP